MLTSRQERLLKLIVEEYIKKATPISSKELCEVLDCSSATVRNEMAFLEDNLLIEKTHTSSGRIPSEKGYRYYVDNILEPKELNGEDMLKLQTIFHNNALMLNDAIIKSMEIISDLTNYTMVVLGNTSSSNRVNKVEVIPIDEENIVALIITDKGHVEHKNINLQEKVDVKEIKQTVEIINKLIINTPLDEVSSKLEFEIKPVIEQYVKQHEVLYNAFYNAFSDFTKDAVKVTGTSNILKQPEFDDVDRVKEIVGKFDDQDMIKKIKADENGINIYIGSENNFDENMTIVKTKFQINGEDTTIALVGPKRMEYERVIALLNYIKENIDEVR
ncbi:MAG: heat-inducible transcriptional repressor HrcA [Bacilli bacterium]|nr:heat-inducible transcriptional repressor HrcA [Bacilli bacterium]